MTAPATAPRMAPGTLGPLRETPPAKYSMLVMRPYSTPTGATATPGVTVVVEYMGAGWAGTFTSTRGLVVQAASVASADAPAMVARRNCMDNSPSYAQGTADAA